MPSIVVQEYLDRKGISPWGAWFDALDAVAAAKVAIALYRLGESNFSNVKGVGGGVLERVIDWGPGYRIYFGRDGQNLIILLGGSTKKRQQKAIEEAGAHWADYRRRRTKA